MPDRHQRTLSSTESLQEYGRGLAGGLLFSLPLLYTMEVWWSGFLASPLRLLALLAFTYVLLLGYNRFAGLRYDASWSEVAIDSIEELGLGLVTAAALLFLLGRIGFDMSVDETRGKIVVEAVVVAIGFSVGTAQLHAGGEEDAGKGDSEEKPAWTGELVIAFCGAVLFAANVAPTEEIVMIGVETGAGRLLGLVALTMAMGALILYFTNFRRTDRAVRHESHLDVVRGSTITYAIGLVASAVILWFFGRFDGASAEVAVRQTVVLGLPATLGASAGRLLLTSS
jgi:putative integral membrane protein (TIGR02587 family)